VIVGMRVVFLGRQQYCVRRSERNDGVTSAKIWYKMRAVRAGRHLTHGTSAKESKVAGLSPVKYATSQSVGYIITSGFRTQSIRSISSGTYLT
jgi:hypothetical protein